MLRARDEAVERRRNQIDIGLPYGRRLHSNVVRFTRVLLKRLLRRRLLTSGLALAFACRALVPVGFMPAPLDSGGPIVLCPGGAGGAIARFLSERAALEHAHHPQHEHAPDSHDAWEYCPVGASLGAAALPTTVDLALPILEHVLEAVEPTRVIHRLLPRSYRARAPPAF